jgi:acetyltransferase-like isoleucine patch superfamily enzyme
MTVRWWERRSLKEAAKGLVATTYTPGRLGRRAGAALFHAHWVAREAREWVIRALVATPVFLSRCARHGARVAVDRVPYLNGRCRIELGDDVRISGLVNIRAPFSSAEPLLKIGSAVFIAHGTTLVVAERVEIGDYVSLGSGTFVSDTDGHSHARLDTAIWNDPAGPGSVAPVVIEDNVHVARNCTILKGVRIGARSLIGAGSVVRSNVPPDSVVMGNPARVVGWRRAQGAPPRAAAQAPPPPPVVHSDTHVVVVGARAPEPQLEESGGAAAAERVPT